MEEENAIRYVVGYVVMKMKKKYEQKESADIHQTLLSMEEDTTRDEQDDDEHQTFLAYTCAWLTLINRGGLFAVRDEVYSFFLEMELCMYPLLRRKLNAGDGREMSKMELIQAVECDEDVRFAWSLVALDLSEDDSYQLFKDVIELWLTIRGHSIASQLTEMYKEALGVNTGKNLALRKQLKVGHTSQEGN